MVGWLDAVLFVIYVRKIFSAYPVLEPVVLSNDFLSIFLY